MIEVGLNSILSVFFFKFLLDFWIYLGEEFLCELYLMSWGKIEV